QMELTKQQFGKTGGTVAFHAYQSFRPGEVTPEQCHAIGVELAKRVWGDRFQVLISNQEIIQHFKNKGIQDRTVNLVKGRLNIRSVRKGDKWYWQLNA
ncbi:relaxase/mobilization nuclease domain-containing protein, partial [uncultured Gemmiger sp.]|uniref:relaxase/mobilization nuclease domain-containing protein n=1 Tax=uncultured Gemmiger sp. TaxID=1623490 RepID=UPI0026666A09